MRYAREERRGFVLVAVIFAVAMMSLVVVVAFSTADDERRSARASRESTLALYAAEAGLRATIANWPTVAAAALNPGDSVDLGWITLPNRGNYRAVITRVDNGGLQHYSVAAHGRRANTYGGQSSVVSMVAGVARFKSAISTQGSVSMTGSSNGLIDAYDSDAGPYSPLTGDTATITSNGSISLYNTFTVRGDVKAAGTTWSTSGVTGQVTPLAQPFPAHPILPCPAGGYTPTLPSGGHVHYSATTGVLRVDEDANLILSGPQTQYYFSQLTVEENATLTVNASGPRVDIWVDDWLAFAPGKVVNQSGKATKLAFWSCGSPATPARWYPSGGAGAFYSLYAPNHDIQILSGSGTGNDIYGALVGASLVMPSTTRLHYDAALTRMPTTQLTVLPGSWAQLPDN